MTSAPAEPAAQSAPPTATELPTSDDPSNTALPSSPAQPVETTEIAAPSTPDLAVQSASDAPAVEPAAAAFAEPAATTSATSSTPVSLGPMTLIVNREYTGTGHGTNAQCGINSANTQLFPDGNLAGAPADDSPADQYACHRDSIGYSLEFNFGSTTLTQPYKATVTLDIRDQVAGTSHPDYIPYNFPANAEAMCSGSGMYNGRLLSINRSGGGTMVCEFEFLPGVAGTVKLPTLNFNYGAYQGTITDRFNPAVTIQSGTTRVSVPDVPKTTVIAAPRIDPVLSTSISASTCWTAPNQASCSAASSPQTRSIGQRPGHQPKAY